MLVLEPFLERTMISVVCALVIAVFIERSLAVVFDWSRVKPLISGRGLKVPIAFLVSGIICFGYPVDFLGMVMDHPDTFIGKIISTGLLAGGSKRIAEMVGDLKTNLQQVTSGREAPTNTAESAGG